ncbi:protein PLANT CADMIUM RESISTANCE 2-like [Populus alba x Populus x berolinensis]|uniref:Protein PLANT CADMIUM RESISTANCE 2-like n=3 Tax=Populus TaxID=3689 RepID=A0A4U5M4L3_POPAL|nr:protein PLANT CADMIUM RESISTANCE 2-like [Populus alba]KAG6759515.1 hypothetical protein POTOM_035996 [Populus tomentosa]KAJ6899077.1 protein PLANT CADMIUM RESISTANCE 2-like [Populus alba x Populus x berolinensis]KAJ6981962.1 protein PLANT CADMIUM RESISTANCE 2-like [Populus alba x Populus x berolinensis]TKR63741.1 protein PLANT CADMIUM RESISTANCE 2-like [Populus alba]
MYSSNSSSYDKFSTSQPPVFSQDTSTTGIPVSTTSQFYSTDDSRSSIELRSKSKGPWSTGLCNCFDDWRNCCVTFWCPCITFGRIAEIVDKGSSSCGVNGALYALISCVTFCPCCYSCFYRAKMRQQFLLRKTPGGDCLVHCCCEYCSLCQEYRELKNRGYDLTMGWHGNVEKKNRSVEMASVPPTVEEGMSR